MTKLTPEQVEKLEAAAERATKGPYYAGVDSARECGPHKDSGLALVETGRQSDWPIARLCEWRSAEYIANCDPDTILTLCREWRERGEALEKIANRGVPVQREEHRIARAALKGADHDKD